jgi:hypothetical protein
MLAGFLGNLANVLITGNESALENLLAKKLEELGEDALMQLVGNLSPDMGIANRVVRAVETGGESEFNRARNEWLHAISPTPLPGANILQKLEDLFEKRKQQIQSTRPDRPEGNWWMWSNSRHQWIDQRWRHNWRSQPRDWHGRWEPGRLRHPYISKGARRIRRQRRAAARKAAKQLMQGFIEDGN